MRERTEGEAMSDKTDTPMLPNNDLVICPKCVHQFMAIPVSVQRELSALQASVESTEKDAARAWCDVQYAKYAGRDDCCSKWRFRPVRVRETVRVVKP